MWANWHHGLIIDGSLDIFPYGVPIGLILLYLIWRRHEAMSERQRVVFLTLTMYLFVPYIVGGSVMVYMALIFATFTTRHRLVVYGALWVLFLVAVFITYSM
jgi:hypothetical protein